MDESTQDTIMCELRMAEAFLAGAMALAEFKPADRGNLELLMEEVDGAIAKAHAALCKEGSDHA